MKTATPDASEIALCAIRNVHFGSRKYSAGERLAASDVAIWNGMNRTSQDARAHLIGLRQVVAAK